MLLTDLYGESNFMSYNLLLKKIYVKLEYKIIMIIGYVNHEFYMKLLNKYLKKIGVNILGDAEFIANNVDIDGTDYSLITLGNKIVISKNVILLTHDFSNRVGLKSIGIKNEKEYEQIKEGITIGEHSFIGAGSIILPGTNIGKYSIIGAGAVIKGNIPDYSIVIGNPSKVVGDVRDYGKRFKI